MLVMDQWKTTDFSESVPSDLGPSTSIQPFPSHRLQNSSIDSRQRSEPEVKDPITARKVQKADREKLRRDRLNEHFQELGNTLDPDRPKNDKATILTDTIQVLKDLTAEVIRLKAECAALSEESRELMQEKNELREEKTSLKSDIENLNAQYQQRVRVMFPWTTVDPSIVVAPPYSYPVPVPVPPGPIPMHSTLQPFPFFGAQNPAAIPNLCSTYIPYPAPTNPSVERPSAQHACSSNTSGKQDSERMSTNQQRSSSAERCEDPNDVATDLELKMPGSSAQQNLSPGDQKSKQTQEKSAPNVRSPSSRYSSSQCLQENSTSAVSDPSKSNE